MTAIQAAMIILLFIGFIFPGQIFIGPLRISIYRIVLLFYFIPMIVACISEPKKRFYFIDALIIIYVIFCLVSFAYYNNGIATMGVFILETLGPYIMARAIISNADSMKFAFGVFFVIATLLIPFTAYENLTGRPILLNSARPIFPYVFPDSDPELRYNMYRPQVVFEHAILYGMFCTMVVAPALYIVGYGRAFFIRLIYLAIAVLATIMSLSAGPLIATGFQLMLITWDHGFFIKAIKWKVFLALMLIAYIIVEVFSNRPPIHVFIHYFTFNAGTAFTRVRQWDCGMLSVAKNPILGFGVGGDWTRCQGVTNSIDNFFLAMAMRNGAPAILALLLAMILILVQVGRAPTAGPRESAFKRGALIALAGTAVGAATVHFWNATYSMLFFLMGSTMWLLDDSRARSAIRNTKRSAFTTNAAAAAGPNSFSSSESSSPRSRPGRLGNSPAES